MKPVKSVLLALVFVFFAASLYAGDKALILNSSDPGNGSDGFPVDQSIQLTFSKNVVNFTVAKANSACFHLETASGQAAEIIVEMGDDQIEPELKQTIKILPVNHLEGSVEYLLTISGSLKAKNGNTLGEDLVLHFTTGS